MGFVHKKKEKENGRPSESPLWVEILTKAFYGKEWLIFFKYFEIKIISINLQTKDLEYDKN